MNLEHLTPLGRRCVLERIKDPTISQTDAYLNAGGKAKRRSVQRQAASEIFTNPDVIKALEEHNIELYSAAIATREQLLEDLTDIANADIADVMEFGQTGHEYIDTDTGEVLPGQSIISVKNMSELSPEARRLIKSVKQTAQGVEVTLHCPMAARKMIIDMQGYNSPLVTINKNTEISDDEFDDELEKLGIE